METVTTINDIRARVSAWRRNGERVAFVPTMGNLHAGHVELVRRARAMAHRVVVSIFVNPLQFGPNEDFERYPRTPEGDAEKLVSVGTDLLFLPSVPEMYPGGRDGGTTVDVPGISDMLCGASRPGHFRGVATVVAKLLNIVAPDLALFGEKDFQQIQVIRQLVADLNLPLEVIGVPTVREPDGLAMSSRNGYLTADERARAPALHEALVAAAERLQAGENDYIAIELEVASRLGSAGLRPDYVSIRRREDLASPAAGERGLVILAAAYLGKARLIDNMQLER